MAYILPSSPPEQSYDPDTLHAMGAVFDVVHRQQPSFPLERVARAVIDVVRKDMDDDELRAAVLNHLCNRH